MRILTQRIFRHAVILQLDGIRNALEPNRIARIANQAQVVWVDTNMKELVQPLRQLSIETKPLN